MQILQPDSESRLHREARLPACSTLAQAVADLRQDKRQVLVIDTEGSRTSKQRSPSAARYDRIRSAADVRAYSARRLGLIYSSRIPAHVLRRIWAEIQLLNPLAEIRFVELRAGSEIQRSSSRLLS